MSESFSELALAASLFLASHSIPAVPRLRRKAIALAGERTYVLAYSALSLGLLAWLITAAITAPYLELWPQAPWTRWVPILAMPVSCVLLVAGLTSPNPLSVSMAGRPFDPEHAGIVAVTRHPVLWGFSLWALAHLPPNGNLAGVLLFGLFAAFGLGGMLLVDVKAKRRLGPQEWRALATRTSVLPFAAMLAGRTRFRLADMGVVRLSAGLALFALLLSAHWAVIGRWPLPF